MLKRWAGLLLCLILAASLAACGGNNTAGNPTDTPAATGTPSGSADQTATPAADKIKVSVTFNAMKEFVAAVGQDKVEISTIIPDGTEPHDFEPKAQDLVALSAAKVFVYSGLGMEAWADKAVQAANNPDLVTVEASKGGTPITNTDPGEIEEHGQYDPHIWLSLKGAELEVKNIKDGLVQADPANKDFYEKNCGDFVAQLEKLYNDYNEKFQSVTKKSFVTGHAAFAYLCRDFSLTQNSVEDTFAEGEPSAQKLTELVDYCKQNDVKTIFVEDMVSPAVSQTLAGEVGATVETIYTIESGEDDMTYLDRMTDNLTRIYDSLTK
ncbi:zinc transport system substrate-binding protein [Sporobacter termitidis DSM 10068]|uniref:Zinc transport system substrate-binding protein n=1 Tax=Sporobacter termitidis DSM 10068 TaxID=1123282 RepID=A0A1M5XGF0_9FIRM|nr:metal ABC transporter substrate-binding protein [Sporobacter termitidis]SHH98819.1 zinc transport system substrate-binding protein [Sporobacter termitidis DSM 10068]